MTALDAALSYADRGWAVVPLTGKHPNWPVLSTVYGTNSWKQLGQQPASPDEIRAWVEADSTTGIGIICGQPSGGLVVADFDTDQPRFLPPTPTVRTGRGRHAYFRDPTVTSTVVQPWGELRSTGSYVVAPPSRHDSGRGF